MARVIKRDGATSATHKGWLKLAEEVKRNEVKRNMGTVDVYRHMPMPEASVERVREFAGVIRLTGPAPSRKFLKDDGDPA